MKSLALFLKTPARVVIAVGLIILVVELLTMLLISGVTEGASLSVWDFVDPILLTALVSPALFILIFRPMRNQQVEIERQLVECLRNEQLTALIEAIPDAVFLKDGEGRWLIINEPAKQMFQLHDLPWQGKTDMELADMHPAFRAAHEGCLAGDEKAWQAGKLLVGEEIVPGEDGRCAIIETRKVPLFSKEGQRRGLVIIGRDITERKQTEIALLRSEDNLSRAQTVAQVGSWYLDVATSRLEWSAESRRIFGIPGQDAVDLDTFISVIHPDDREWVLKAWNEALAGAPYDIEHRVVADGKTRWVRELAAIEMDSEDRPISGVGTVQD